MKPYHRFAIMLVGLSAFAVATWGLFQASATPAQPLDQLMPEGSLLYIEAKDFASLLKDWNGSPEKREWLNSADYSVFSKSRLFLRLSKASDEFAAAAGVRPDAKFLADAAGTASAIAVYDIGNLEFLYISRSSATDFTRSALWQARTKFQPRSAAGKQFFSRKDEESGRVVAFAMSGDYVILGTREDLVAGALELLASGGKQRSLRQEGWYTQALAVAPSTPGDLRMVLHLEKIAVTPHFRTYWIQQNITEMQGYTSGICDLYREAAASREERVLLPKAAIENEAALTQSEQAVTGLLALAPKDFAFYQASAANAKTSLATVEQKILAPHFGVAAAEKLAPQVQLTGGESGSASDLETRIDLAPAARTTSENAMASLQKQFEAANPQAMLVVQATHKNRDGVLLGTSSVVVVSAAADWDLPSVQKAVQDVLNPGLTASALGVQWREVKEAGGYSELDGLLPLEVARRGKLLYFANDAAALSAVLQANNPPPAQPVSYAAAFHHGRERQNFYDLTSLVARSAEASSPEPDFFSQNISSFSRGLSRVSSEEIVMRRNRDRIQQTVTYRWNP
jgi:hypothetical protein